MRSFPQLARGGLAVAFLLSAADIARGQETSFDSRMLCRQAIADWTARERVDPAPFHIRPVVAATLAPDAEKPTRAELALGLARTSGVLLAGETEAVDGGFAYPGPSEKPARTEPFASLLVRRPFGPVALLADVTFGKTSHTRELALAGRLGGVLLTMGRLGLWPGNGCSSGLVLSGRGRVDGLGIDTPWIGLPILGRLSLSASLGTIPEAATGNRRPFFSVLRAVWPASEHLVFTATRAMLFGGRATSVPVTFRTVGLMLLGVTDVEGKDSDFENQVASVGASLRTRIAGAPVRFHAEYGVDDYGLAFLRVPAAVLGVEVVPSASDRTRTFGAEVVWIAPSARDYPEWYRHGALAWGWTDEGVPLGHDLAGEGWGLRLGTFSGSTLDGYAADLFVTRRGGENLLARDGPGWGVEASLDGRRRVGTLSDGTVLFELRARGGGLEHHRFFAVSASGIYRF